MASGHSWQNAVASLSGFALSEVFLSQIAHSLLQGNAISTKGFLISGALHNSPRGFYVAAALDG
jgi:hypothetical protein